MQTKEIKSHIEQHFRACGWAEEPVQGEQPLNQIFIGSYAAVGILIADVVDTILENWRECQDYIYTLKDTGRIFPDQDSYLLLVLPHVERGFDKLREVLADTHVCRKICLEIADRTIEEALMELPFFTALSPASENSMNEVVSASPDDAVDTLSTTVLDELAGSSAENVLSRLLLGEYDDREVANED